MANTMSSNRRSSLVTLTTAALCLDDSTIVSTNLFSEGLRMISKQKPKEQSNQAYNKSVEELTMGDEYYGKFLRMSRAALADKNQWRSEFDAEWEKNANQIQSGSRLVNNSKMIRQRISELKKKGEQEKADWWKTCLTRKLKNKFRSSIKEGLFDEATLVLRIVKWLGVKAKSWENALEKERLKYPFEILNFDGKSGSPELQLKCSQKKLTIKDHGLRQEFTEDAEAKGVEAPIWKKHHTELGSRQEWSNFREKYVEFSKTMYPTFLAIGQKRGNNIVEISADYEKHKLHKPETYEGMCLGSLQDTDTSRDGDEVEDDKKLKTAQTHNFNQILADLHRTPLPAKANAKKFTYVEAAKQFNISAFLLLNYHTPYGQGHNYFIAYWLRCMRLESRPDGNVDREAFVAWFLFCLVRQYPWAKCNADIQKLLMSEQAECLYPVWSTEVSRLGTAFCTFIVESDSTGRDTHEIHHDSPEGASLRFNVWEEILSKGKATYFYKLLKHILKNVVASEEVSFENVPKIKSKVQEHLADEANCKTALDTLEKESKLLFKAKQSVWKFFK